MNNRPLQYGLILGQKRVLCLSGFSSCPSLDFIGICFLRGGGLIYEARKQQTNPTRARALALAETFRARGRAHCHCRSSRERRRRGRRRLRQFLFPHRPLNLRDASGKVTRGCVSLAHYLRSLCSVSGGHVACEIASATQDDHGALGWILRGSKISAENLYFAT